MKTIILATDFSKSANPASDFALQAVFTPMEQKNKESARRKLYRLRDWLKKTPAGKVEISVSDVPVVALV